LRCLGRKLPPPPPQPAQAGQHVPGLTDRRYEGFIATWRTDKGFGFIRCQELRQKFPDKDVFLHNKQVGSFKEGDAVTFAIVMNRDGRPQATDLQPAGGAAAGGGGGGMQQGMQQGMGMQGQFNGQGAGMQAAAPAPPAPAAPAPPTEEQATHEVEVPADLVSKLTGEGGRGLQELKMKAGGDISITFQARPELANAVMAVVKGPKVLASLGAILVLQEVSELVEIPA